MLYVILLSLLVSFIGAAYDPALGAEYGELSMLAYCDSISIQDGSCDYYTGNLDKSYVLFRQREGYLVSNGVSYALFVNPKLRKIVSSFRGTTTGGQMITEGVLSYLINYSGSSKIQASKYFYNAYQVLRSVYLSDLTDAVKKYPDYTFVFTGHSLGAALATHAALDAVLSSIIKRSQTVMYNYGSPRVGDQDFVDLVTSNIGEIARVTYSNDKVPHLPPLGRLGVGFRHVGPEVFYFGDSDDKFGNCAFSFKLKKDPSIKEFKDYRICDNQEDNCCSNRNPDASFDKGSGEDHHLYPGFNKKAQEYRAVW